MDLSFEKLTVLKKWRVAASDAEYGGGDEPMPRKDKVKHLPEDRSGVFRFFTRLRESS